MSTRSHVLTCLAACVAGCSPSPHPQVSAIEIVAYGEMEYGQSTSGIDPASPIGARLALAQGMHVAHQTERIPLRSGVAYGVAFVVRGSPPDAVVDVRVLLRSSAGCILKTTGEVVYENETILPVRIGRLRHISGRIVDPQDDHCASPMGPSTDTFEIFYGGKKLAEKRFELVNDAEAAKAAP